jgi:hypothetical protein
MQIEKQSDRKAVATTENAGKEPSVRSEEPHLRLQRRFRKQQIFTEGYSPLYSRMLGLLADWLSAGQGDELSRWLLAVASRRASFDVPLLLLAGLHREVLAGNPQMHALARFFPSVGGSQAADSEELGDSLRRALLAGRTELAAFVAGATVQTNETGRGLCWLLPTLYPGWSAMHLVELGASAGLNLAADQRHYRLICAADGSDRGNGSGGETMLELGCGEPDQFVVVGEGDFQPPPATGTPLILSRQGCDVAPLALDSERDEQTLAAFVWADQLQRLALLRQGLAALRRVSRPQAPVRIHPANLPGDLARLLNERVSPLGDAPIVLYNTYLTTYLHERGALLRPQLAVWAERHPQPVLWLQWETLWQGPKPPHFGWLGWTADVWIKGRHRCWQLAWAHPHGGRIQWLPGLADWAGFWQGHRA